MAGAVIFVAAPSLVAFAAVVLSSARCAPVPPPRAPLATPVADDVTPRDAAAPAALSTEPAIPPNPYPPPARCPADMAEVSGRYCPDAEERCLEWSDDGRPRCLRFARPSRCAAGRREPMDFCIDRYEWPDRAGELPVVMVSWNEAAAMCASLGKRLCTQDEWTFACEGEDMLPYPYGYEREPGACTVDHFARAPDHRLLGGPPAVAMAEAMRVYEAAPSGSASRCVSPFGVYDLTGSVDEWTVNETGVPFHSALKGGWWGRVRGRCRPATLVHDEQFRYYEIGFRCCEAAR